MTPAQIAEAQRAGRELEAHEIVGYTGGHRTMIRIAITAAAFEAVSATLPLGSNRVLTVPAP
jgi:hypothetical protein